MAFTLEDGSGVEGANAYITVTEFKTHHDDRGQDYTGAEDDDAIEVAIVLATDYADKRFGRRFRGWRQDRQQGLEWPRTDAFTDDDYLLTGIPAALKKAISEYALLVIQLGRNLAPAAPPDFGVLDPATGEVVNNSSGRVVQRTEKVGPIEDSTRYADGNSSGRPMVGTGNLVQRIPDYPQADLWMEELITSYTDRGLYRG